MASETRHMKTIRLATACTECRRRKQKARNTSTAEHLIREWPCNQCQARRLSHLCKFTSKRESKTSKRSSSNSRVMNVTERNDVYMEREPLRDTSIPPTNAKDLRVLGYLPDNLGGSGRSVSISIPQGTPSPEFENVLRMIPPKPYTDILVQHFLNETNYQYYCIYPPTFSLEYSAWWAGKAKGQPLTSEFTCLLLRVCACSALFLGPGDRQKLESELGESIQRLSERYHHAARQLSGTISPGKGGLTQVQQLFLTACWLKTEALFVESWHALSSAIHEAQELGTERPFLGKRFSEFELEMRRRIWCILYTWDWQMSQLLSRPVIINSSYCSVETPNLRLENPDPQIELPSPITNMSLLCQLGQEISKIPGVMCGDPSPMQAISVQEVTEKWFASFPSAFRLVCPDTRWDSTHKYVVMQRLQLHAIGYMVMLMPLKQCLVQALDQDTPSVQKSLWSYAIGYALKLMDASYRLLGCMLPMNAKFYFAPFLIFDTATFLCSAIIHDHSQHLPQRETVIRTLSMSINMLEQVRGSKTGAICYSILKRLIHELPLSSTERISIGHISSEKVDKGPYTTLESQHISTLLQDDAGVGSHEFVPLELASSEATGSGLADIANVDLGTFSQIWDWGDLDLDFLCPPRDT
ncbi:hypothetical protein BDV23DRAFT_171346 [Aspergillus alliaceus]|uniref:Xylanolytic transcriptional activator regulatory domain-containing protein n=1 Tax=Petromyces alliaceus TaxID=209559 RepID=A0A5N7CCX1_PETAA|nr:hypothetical protein BDV23DRAFT_171346 [Aspergillus alliaceus]